MTTPRPTKQDQLFGLLAVQLGFLTSEALERHAARFAREGEGDLGAWLAKEGLLKRADVALLEACIAQTLQVHASPARALTALTLGAQALTLASLSVDDTVGSGRGEASVDSLERLDFVVPELAGRYASLHEELGRGGLGRVLAFRDHVLGRTIAWKELHHPEGARDPLDQEARFLREARLSAQLEHPSIVPIYEVGRRVDGALFYTMRRIEGRTLADALHAAGTLDERLKLMPHLVAMTQALAYAHSRDVLHRDVKPHNVMLGRFGETYLLDWGLAKVKQHSSSLDAPLAPDISGGVELGVVGTPAYMSPEQAAGRHDIVDQRTDVWGVGAVLYELLTGRPPYQGDSAIDCIARILKDDLLPVRMLEPSAPRDLAAVCEKALQRRPADRYPDAAAMATDLQAWLDGRAVSARELSLSERLARFVRRNRLALAAVSALLVALIASGGYFTWSLEQKRREARALSGTVLHAFITELSQHPGAEDILDEVATPSLAYFRAQGDLSTEEALTFQQTLQAIGFTSLYVGRIEPSAAAFGECADRARALGEQALAATPRLRATLLTCLVGRAGVAALSDDRALAKRLMDEARQLVARYEQQDRNEVRWVSSLSFAYGRFASAAQDDGDLEASLKWSELEVATDVATLALSPNEPNALIAHASSTTRLALSVFSPSNPARALELSRQGLTSIRAVPGRLQTPRVLRVWLGLLEGFVMMSNWLEPGDETQQAVTEAKMVFGQLNAIEPHDLQGRAVYADLLLANHDPCASKHLYDALITEGARGTYFTSWLLAALACGEDDALEKTTEADLTKNADPQARWTSALWLVTKGRRAEAIDQLTRCAEEASMGAIQYPRGVLDGLPARTPERDRAAVEHFLVAMEKAMRDPIEQKNPAFEQLRDELKAR